MSFVGGNVVGSPVFFHVFTTRESATESSNTDTIVPETTVMSTHPSA